MTRPITVASYNMRKALGTDRRRNPLRVLDSKHPDTQALLAGAPNLHDALSPESHERFQRVRQGLEDLGIPFTLNPRLVRGLDYYSHTAFEITSTQLGAQATVCGGGRYDGLVGQLGGPATAAVLTPLATDLPSTVTSTLRPGRPWTT